MTLHPVGPSSYGSLRGVVQYVTDETVAAQVNSLIAESAGVFADGGILSVNEGLRSRRDQEIKRAAWEAFVDGGPWAPLAAVPYTSSHDQAQGAGLDFGITLPDGRNRALEDDEAAHAWVVARGRLRGIRHTGRDFRPTPESWHFTGGYPASLNPLDPEEVDMTPEEKKQLAAVLDAVTTTKSAVGRVERRQVVIVDAVVKIKVAVGDVLHKVFRMATTRRPPEDGS